MARLNLLGAKGCGDEMPHPFPPPPYKQLTLPLLMFVACTHKSSCKGWYSDMMSKCFPPSSSPSSTPYICVYLVDVLLCWVVCVQNVYCHVVNHHTCKHVSIELAWHGTKYEPSCESQRRCTVALSLCLTMMGCGANPTASHPMALASIAKSR